MTMMMGSFVTARRVITITLLNSMKLPVCVWNIIDVFSSELARAKFEIR